MARGGRLSTRSSAGLEPAYRVSVRVEGLERTSDGFKRVRRNVNTVMRDAQEKVGNRVVLPTLQGRFSSLSSSWSQTLYVKRDRMDVFIGSRLRSDKNRALGWLDFGGQRPQDRRRRIGPHLITGTLDDKQTQIRDDIYQAIVDEFAKNGFQVS